jgi:hypothetical protein
MSTKRLSKTVIEGGRYGRNKFERRYSHVEVRAQTRDYLKAVIADPEHAEEYDIDPISPVYQGFSDKLSPMYRWIDAQVGRPWDEVRSEVFKTFDTRTTAGRHITFDHLLKEVVDTESGFDEHGTIADPETPKESTGTRRGYWSISDYYVDKDGILCGKENRHRRYNVRYETVTEEEMKEAAAWLEGRMIMEKGGKLHWLAPTTDIWMASWFDPYTHVSGTPPTYYYGSTRSSNLSYYVWRSGEYKTNTTYYPAWDMYRPHQMTTKIHGDHWEKVEAPYSFRLRGQLTVEEIKIFRNMKERLRDEILAFGQGR